MGIESRIKRLEKIKEGKPPTDLFGRYYDTLNDKEKRRFWRYVYEKPYSVAKAEEKEMQIRNSLHFICEQNAVDLILSQLPDLDYCIRKLNI